MYDQYYTERISKFMKWAEERIAQEHAKNQKIIQECGTDEMSDTPKIDYKKINESKIKERIITF